MAKQSKMVLGKFRRPIIQIVDTAALGCIVVGDHKMFGRQRLPTESVGTYPLTLTNVVIGSRYSVETLAGESLVIDTASSSTIVLDLPVYASGNEKNNVRVKIGKASEAPYYARYETQLTMTPKGSSTIFINQVRDDI